MQTYKYSTIIKRYIGFDFMYHMDRYIDYSPFRKPYIAVGTVKNKFRCTGLQSDLFCSPLDMLELRDKKVRYIKRGMCHISFMQSWITYIP